MGDFDRHPKPQTSKQGKQIIIAIVLGVVLIGLTGSYLMKPGPQKAFAGAEGAGDGALAAPAPVPDETAEQASNALKDDPTARLLRESAPDDELFSKIPRNPFVMSDSWRNVLVRTVESPQTPAPPASETPRAPRAVPQPVKLENYRLASIVRLNDKLTAIINGHIASAGMIVDGARIVEIRPDRVILQNAQFNDGPMSELTLEPKLKP
jgi:hypothetical protein